VHYLVPGVRIVYQPKFLGAGGEIVSFYGQKQDFYLLAFGLVKLGWFHLGLGGSMMVKLPQDQQEIWTSMLLDRLLPAVSLGVNSPIWKLGPGRLELNASLDAFMSAFPISTEFALNPPPNFEQNLKQNPPQAFWQAISTGIGTGIGAGIGRFFYAFFSTFKLTGGLSYVIAF